MSVSDFNQLMNRDNESDVHSMKPKSLAVFCQYLLCYVFFSCCSVPRVGELWSVSVFAL